jgi:short subunit dehydrogenase-like uncharacterized protein
MLIAVYGANGYQAGLVLAELARRDLPMVLVARDPARLREAAAEAGVAGAPRRVAGIDDHDALTAAFSGCDAVINCAGPFTPSGHAVIRAAIAAGCHYLDTAGEQLYIKSVFDTVPAAAERAGVAVIPAANDGCVPGDLLAHLLGERVPALQEIVIGHFIAGGGGMSRGSLRSIVATGDTMRSGGLVYDGGDWRTGAPARYRSITLPDGQGATAVARLPLAEVVTIPRHMPVRYVEGVADAAIVGRLAIPLPAEAIDALPEGPAAEERRGQRFTYVIDAIGEDGPAGRAIVRGCDTYGTTAVIAVEAARRVIADGARPGVLTPAQAYDPASFLDFLAGHGIRWSIDSPAGQGSAFRNGS